MKQRQPGTTDERLEWVAEWMTTWNKRQGLSPAANRFDVHKQLECAFAGDYELDQIEINGVLEDAVTFPGIFMLVFNSDDDLDYRDPATQKRISQIVDAAITRC